MWWWIDAPVSLIDCIDAPVSLIDWIDAPISLIDWIDAPVSLIEWIDAPVSRMEWTVSTVRLIFVSFEMVYHNTKPRLDKLSSMSNLYRR